MIFLFQRWELLVPWRVVLLICEAYVVSCFFVIVDSWVVWIFDMNPSSIGCWKFGCMRSISSGSLGTFGNSFSYLDLLNNSRQNSLMFHLKAGNSWKQQFVLSWKLTDPLPATTFDEFSIFPWDVFFCATIARTHTLILSDTSEVYGCGGNDKALSSRFLKRLNGLVNDVCRWEEWKCVDMW